MEVTDAQKAELETADAQWEEPSEELITRWNGAWRVFSFQHGQYNRETGFFEGNGVTNINNTDALRILDIGNIYGISNISGVVCPTDFGIGRVPTLLPIRFSGYRDSLRSVHADVVRFIDYYTMRGYPNPNNAWNPDKRPMAMANSQQFFYASEIKHVLGIFDVKNDASYQNHFYNGFPAGLETLWVINIYKNLHMGSLKNFRLECFRYMIENAKGTEPLTITVHPDVYAKVTGDETNTAYNSLTAEEKEEWTALLDMAADKNITFATT